jgi:hypothetical protein
LKFIPREARILKVYPARSAGSPWRSAGFSLIPHRFAGRDKLKPNITVAIGQIFADPAPLRGAG